MSLSAFSRSPIPFGGKGGLSAPVWRHPASRCSIRPADGCMAANCHCLAIPSGGEDGSLHRVLGAGLLFVDTRAWRWQRCDLRLVIVTRGWRGHRLAWARHHFAHPRPERGVVREGEHTAHLDMFRDTQVAAYVISMMNFVVANTSFKDSSNAASSFHSFTKVAVMKSSPKLASSSSSSLA